MCFNRHLRRYRDVFSFPWRCEIFMNEFHGGEDCRLRKLKSLLGGLFHPSRIHEAVGVLKLELKKFVSSNETSAYGFISSSDFFGFPSARWLEMVVVWAEVETHIPGSQWPFNWFVMPPFNWRHHRHRWPI